MPELVRFSDIRQSFLGRERSSDVCISQSNDNLIVQKSPVGISPVYLEGERSWVISGILSTYICELLSDNLAGHTATLAKS